MLDKGHVVLLRRAELKMFVDFHSNEGRKGGDLTPDETTIIVGALELIEKTAKDAMTPISKAFSLDMDGTLNLWIDIGYVRMRYGALWWDHEKRKLEAGIKDNTTENIGRLFGKKKRKRTYQEEQ
ncbi:DUF21 domain-containing protein [Capsicum baccatum]|uniref:DUF21 domain-containing protein n=1 Tax=Capsicum baccatum TaxID=33114 RepID=A0A2G2WE35_CAPBA|nr:DUF21 domain-containing protein [Capsicum baccatum]